MNKSKQLIIDNLSVIPDNIQGEFEVLEGLYKLIKLEKSRESAREEGTFSSDSVREHFANKHVATGV